MSVHQKPHLRITWAGKWIVTVPAARDLPPFALIRKAEDWVCRRNLQEGRVRARR